MNIDVVICILLVSLVKSWQNIRWLFLLFAQKFSPIFRLILSFEGSSKEEFFVVIVATR